MITLDKAREDIRRQFIDIVARLGEDGTDVQDDEILPGTGLIDSTGLLELVAWYEAHFEITLKQEEINIDNLGSIDSMARYALLRRGQPA